MANESLYRDNNINGMRISFTRVQKEQKKNAEISFKSNSWIGFDLGDPPCSLAA